MTQQEWRQFLDRWSRYKTTALEPNSYTPMQTENELWFCRCKELQNNLQHVGIVAASTEEEIFTKINDLAVKAISPLLNLCNYFKMFQREAKNVCQYVARLKGAANLGDFTVSHGAYTVSYVNHMVLSRLVASFRDKQIMREILK